MPIKFQSTCFSQRVFIATVCFVLFVAMAWPCRSQQPSRPLRKPNQPTLPNILLIVADDMGYSDLGCFGGEIDTPSIDSIAAGGVRFTNFFVNPMCTVTRTSLITGHEHSQSDEYRNSIPITKMLRQAGYRSSISGKWHQPGHPLDAGFDSFYGFLKGEINGWLGTYTNNKTHAIVRDRNPPQQVDGDWYCSDAFADDAIKQMETAVQSNKPFFAYVPFNAPHGPLHAPESNVKKYAGRFDAGWDALRGDRIKRMRRMGIIDARYKSNVPEAECDSWNELSDWTKKIEATRFCAYAAMVDRMDQNVGRLLGFLDQQQIADNTIVIFFSDNGGNYSHGAIEDFAKEIPWAPTGPRPACATGWGRLMNTPFSWYKTSAFRGGVSSPLMIRWPKKTSVTPGSILKHRLHVSDIYPTLIDVAQVSYRANPTPATQTTGKKSPPQATTAPKKSINQPQPPQSTLANSRAKPLYGRSFLPLLDDNSRPTDFVRDEIFWGFQGTTKGLLKGRWKIVSINDSPWQLYDLDTDPAESSDVASRHPEIVQRLNDRWYKFANVETNMAANWKQPLRENRQGWGLHRVQMTMPLDSISPACSQRDVDLRPTLTMSFSKPIDFRGTENKKLSLYSVGNPAVPVWQFDPAPNHPAQGKSSISFSLPTLEPSTSYYLLTDPGWAKFDNRPAAGLNDGAFFYRFRTRER